MMNKWFAETFLLSLYERANGRTVNITAKQVNVCIRYMEKHTGRRESLYNTVGKVFLWYSTEWNGRTATMSIYPNGCGCIEFGMTEEEQERAAEEEDRRKAEERTARIEKIKANPERLQKHLERLNKNLTQYNEELQFYKDLSRTEDFNEDDRDTLEYYEEKVAETWKKIQELTA